MEFVLAAPAPAFGYNSKDLYLYQHPCSEGLSRGGPSSLRVYLHGHREELLPKPVVFAIVGVVHVLVLELRPVSRLASAHSELA